MKKVIVMFVLGLFLFGCAAGINHNTTIVNNKSYLIETPTRSFLGLFQWSEESKYHDNEEALAKEEKIKEFRPVCEKEVQEKIDKKQVIKSFKEENIIECMKNRYNAAS